MRHPLLAIALFIFPCASTLDAQTVEVDQPSRNAVMATFGSIDLAQSFRPTTSTCSGASASMSGGRGTGGTVTIQLWTALPNAGGTMLASGSDYVIPAFFLPTWADVLWPPVSVTPGATYYLVFLCTDSLMAVDGDTNNPYLDGQTYANPGFGSFPNYDFTFRTWAETSLVLTATGTPGGTMTFQVSSATPSGRVAFLYALGTGSQTAWNPLTGNTITTALSWSGFTIGPIELADTQGNASTSTVVPPGAAGSIMVQAVDASTDTVSNVFYL